MVLKRAKPTSPGRRGLVVSKTPDLWKGKPEKSLLEHQAGIIQGELQLGIEEAAINSDTG